MNWTEFFRTLMASSGHAKIPPEIVVAMDDHQTNIMADKLKMLPLLGGSAYSATDQAIEYRELHRSQA